MITLNPSSIALIGASGESGKLGNYILKNLIEGSYSGTVYPINPKHTELLGQKCFHSIDDVPGAVDMAIIATPAKTVAELLRACGKKGVQTAVIISAGFSELGTLEGKEAEQRLHMIASESGMRIIGPNCLGILRPSIGLNASFAETPKRSGKVALLSQSGAMAVALMDALSDSIGFSSIVSMGNKVDLTEVELLEALEDDPETKVIGLYLESIHDGEKFIETAARIGKKKPIILIKAGVSVRGAKAVSSHTGALAGSSTGVLAAATRAGIRIAKNTNEFMRLLGTVSECPELPNRSIAILTNAGGPGVLAVDEVERQGLILAPLEAKTLEALKNVLPAAASRANPIDVLGDADGQRYSSSLNLCAKDSSISGILAIVTPQVMTPCTEIAKEIIALKKKYPLLPIIACFMGEGAVHEARNILVSGSVPSVKTPEEGIAALASLLPLPSLPEPDENPRDDDRRSAASALLKGRTGLLPSEIVSDLLALYGLSTPPEAMARSASQAREIADAIGYPVIAKISSPDILHKTDAGGVRSHLESSKEVATAYTEILKNVKKHAPGAALDGVTIQKLLPPGNEFIVGGIRDSSVGPLVMVGLGGIYTEMLRDSVFRIAPVSLEEAYDMLSKLQSWKLLLGMRGKKPLAIDDLASLIATISTIMSDHRSIQEIDCNPVIVQEKDLSIADVKVVVG